MTLFALIAATTLFVVGARACQKDDSNRGNWYVGLMLLCLLGGGMGMFLATVLVAQAYGVK